MKGSLTNSELHEFLHDFQSDETKENLEEFYLHNWERSCHADLPEGVSERVWNKLYSKVHSGQMEQRKPKYAAKISWTRWLQYVSFRLCDSGKLHPDQLNWGILFCTGGSFR